MAFIISLIIRFRWIFLAGAVLAAIGGWGIKQYYDGKAACEAQALKQAASIREKQNEIRNHRPDRAVLIEQLRRGKF